MPEMSALRELMDKAASPSPLEDVYRSALACLKVPGVERACVLVLDDTGTMRFVAGTKLGAECRAAVEGHAPWAQDGADPILVPDLDADESVAAYRPLFRREAIRALALAPLRFGPKLLGKLLLCYPAPHTPTPDELTSAEIVAGHVGVALEHRRIAAALEARLEGEHALRPADRQDARRLGRCEPVLAATLDPAETVKSLARIVVPRVADWCVVSVPGTTQGPAASNAASVLRARVAAMPRGVPARAAPLDERAPA